MGGIPLSFWWARDQPSETEADRRLCGLVRYAYRHVPYYRELFDHEGIDWTAIRSTRELPRIPLLDKAALRENMPRLSPPGLSPDRLQARRTTGTTGTPLFLPGTRQEFFFDAYAWHRLYLRAGLRPHHRQLKFAIPTSGRRRSSWGGGFPRVHVSTLRSPSEKVEALQRVRPHAVFGHASILGEVAHELERRDERIRVPRVFTTSDMLWPNLRERIEARFETEVYDVYGSVETGPLACECHLHRGFHVCQNLVRLELVDDEGRPARRGRMVCTVLWRRSMPLLRYVLGDLGEWADDPCPCGRPGPVLATLHGREHDLVKLPTGEWVSASHLVSLLAGIPGIVQFQVVQGAATRFHYRLVCDSRYPPVGDAEILTRFRRRFGATIQAAVLHVQTIDQPAGAKFTPFLSLARQAALSGNR